MNERPTATNDRFTAFFSRMLRARWFVRAPIWLYRARLGALMGSRMLLLEHVGRMSGARRYAVLEVVDHPGPKRYIVVSGWGKGSQWFRNVTAEPRVRLGLGSHGPAPATAHVLGPDEAEAVFERYAVMHPKAWKRLAPTLPRLMAGELGDSAGDISPATAARVLPVVAFDLD